MSTESLSLKWGTLKAWKLNEGGPAFAALKKYHEVGPVEFGCMQQHDTAVQKDAICEAIDALDAETIWLDWDEREVTKQEAKEYVRNYGKDKQ